jgi:alanyl-tRNA synthetase
MQDLPAFERDAYLRELNTAVTAVWEAQGVCFAALEDTLLYPEGGGQPADRGELNGIPVLDVQKRDGWIVHTLERAVSLGSAHLTLDWPRRFDHMQQHTGQHLLTAVAQDRFGWATAAFHLGPVTCDIELSTAGISPRKLAELEEAVAAEIRAARPVAARRVTAEAYTAEKVRSRGLPEGHVGDIRLVEIAGLDLNTCGGTHVRNSAELELVKLLGTEPIRGGTRLFFVAGRRARLRLEAHELRNALLRTRLGAPDEELVAVLATKLDQIQALERRVRQLEEEAAEALAEALAQESGPLIERHLQGKDAAFLQRTARTVITHAPAWTVFLSGASGDKFAFVLACGAAAAVDAGALGKNLAADLGGRGGGSGSIFQGVCPNLEHRATALAKLKAALQP